MRGRRVSGPVPVAMRPFPRDTRLAMSQENVEIARSWFHRWNAGDREAFDDEIDPDAKIVTAMLGGTSRGRGECAAGFGRSRSSSTSGS